MYNGIGLKTARGSGTNGFVQRNLSYIRPSRILQFSQKNEVEIIEPKIKQQDKSILEHQARREIEVALLELEEKMEEQGFLLLLLFLCRYEKDEITKRVEEERQMRLSTLEERVKHLKEKEEKARIGEGEELHDYGSEAAKKEWMKLGDNEKKRSSSRQHHSRSSRSSRSSSRSRSRSRDRSRRHHHKHHHHHRD